MSALDDARAGAAVVNDRKHRLFVEFELPSFWAEDSTPEKLAEWIEGTDQTYGEALLDDLRMGNVALLVLDSHGDKDSEVIVVTALLSSARVEAVPPSDEDEFHDEVYKLARSGWVDLKWRAKRYEDEDGEA